MKKWITFHDEHGRPLCQIPSREWVERQERSGKRTLSAELRSRIIARDGLVCGLCGGDVEREDVHIDHIFPRALGGGNDPDNLQVAHSRCNFSKGARV